jgi:hypothetical protein
VSVTEVTLDGESLTAADVVAVAREGAAVAIADEAREAVRASRERVETVRPGTPEQLIVLTGPPEAVFVGSDETPLPEPLKIFHSHIHILGLTFDGLQNPDKPDVVFCCHSVIPPYLHTARTLLPAPPNSQHSMLSATTV